MSRRNRHDVMLLVANVLLFAAHVVLFIASSDWRRFVATATFGPYAGPVGRVSVPIFLGLASVTSVLVYTFAAIMRATRVDKHDKASLKEAGHEISFPLIVLTVVMIAGVERVEVTLLSAAMALLLAAIPLHNVLQHIAGMLIVMIAGFVPIATVTLSNILGNEATRSQLYALATCFLGLAYILGHFGVSLWRNVAMRRRAGEHKRVREQAMKAHGLVSFAAKAAMTIVVAVYAHRRPDALVGVSDVSGIEVPWIVGTVCIATVLVELSILYAARKLRGNERMHGGYVAMAVVFHMVGIVMIGCVVFASIPAWLHAFITCIIIVYAMMSVATDVKGVQARQRSDIACARVATRLGVVRLLLAFTLGSVCTYAATFEANSAQRITIMVFAALFALLMIPVEVVHSKRTYASVAGPQPLVDSDSESGML